jgi:hypothetical protein
LQLKELGVGRPVGEKVTVLDRKTLRELQGPRGGRP